MKITLSSVFTKSVLLLAVVQLFACAPKGFQAKVATEMTDKSDIIPELMAEEVAEIDDTAEADQAADLINGTLSGATNQAGGQTSSTTVGADGVLAPVPLLTAAQQLQLALAADPTLGYKVVVVIDKAKEKTTATAQSMVIFKLNEETKKFEIYNPGQKPWRVSTGVQIPITETFTNAEDGTTREVTSSRFTPAGFFVPNVIEAKAKSKAYDAEMPNAVWFWRESGYAIHATPKMNYPRLGNRASHGCIRLNFDNSKIFFDLVKSYGRQPIVDLSRVTGKPVRKKNGDLAITKRYPVVVIVTDMTDIKRGGNKADLKALLDNPELVHDLFHLEQPVASPVLASSVSGN